MTEHKEMLERYHRSSFMFEIKKETIANYGKLFIINSCSISLWIHRILNVFNCIRSRSIKRIVI